MKIVALHTKEGKILAAVRIKNGFKGPLPVAKEGTSVSEIKISGTHEKLDLAMLCRQHKVDATCGKLVEVKAEPQKQRT